MENTQTRVRVSSPADVLAVVPYLLGFHPQRSFVVIGAGGPREHVELGFRYDLPDPPTATDAASIAEHAVAVLAQHKITTAIGVGYGAGRMVTPVADAFAEAVGRHRFRLRELLRVEAGRYWSYLCANVNCCPENGVTFDCQSHPVAAALTAAGIAAYPDRQALAGTLAPVIGAAARARDSAFERACARARGTARLADAGRRAVADALRCYRRGEQITNVDQIAWLAVTLAGLPVRDDAWARMEPRHRDAHLALWSEVVRHAFGRWLPAPASLLAFTAWQSGNGALANVALDVALDADPRYSMALLLRDILSAGIPPCEARLPMSPAEVEASYATR